MAERLKGAIVKAVEAAGNYLRSSGNAKTPYEVEKRAKDIMLRALREAEPQVSVWGEDANGHRERGVSLCPLDTQVNFSRRIGPYGVMAAYIEDGAPIYGAVHLPESGELLVAERDRGARIGGRRVNVSERGGLMKAVVCCDCNVYNEELSPMSMGAIEALARSVVVWRNLGSPAAEYLWLATGMIDGVVVPLIESGHAAGYLAMREAGARVTDGHGKPFSLRSENIIAANHGLHQDLLELVRDSL